MVKRVKAFLFVCFCFYSGHSWANVHLLAASVFYMPRDLERLRGLARPSWPWQQCLFGSGV